MELRWIDSDGASNHELPELPNAGWSVPLVLVALLALRYALLRPTTMDGGSAANAGAICGLVSLLRARP